MKCSVFSPLFCNLKRHLYFGATSIEQFELPCLMLSNHIERGCWFAGGTEPDSFKEFGSRALWSVRELEDPTVQCSLTHPGLKIDDVRGFQ